MIYNYNSFVVDKILINSSPFYKTIEIIYKVLSNHKIKFYLSLNYRPNVLF